MSNITFSKIGSIWNIWLKIWIITNHIQSKPTPCLHYHNLALKNSRNHLPHTCYKVRPTLICQFSSILHVHVRNACILCWVHFLSCRQTIPLANILHFKWLFKWQQIFVIIHWHNWQLSKAKESCCVIAWFFFFFFG